MSVFANGRSIIHKGHGKTQLATAPDVCKTPSPGGPIPIPYPNMSPDSNLTDGAATVTIAGNPVGNTGSTLSRSSGDEAGTAGGVVSSRNMGAFGWSAGSTDVEVEGKGVVRLLDAILTNGNTYNDLGLTIGMGSVSYGDDKQCPRPNCKLDFDLPKHRISQDAQTQELSSQLASDVAKFGKGRMGGIGRMVGVARCKCGVVYKAVSGHGPQKDHEIEALDALLLPGSPARLCNSVAAPAGDSFMEQMVAVNDEWVCAAAKIFSQASGHQIVALLERWVGAKQKDGSRLPKLMTGATVARFPLAAGVWTTERLDMVENFDQPEKVASGGGVPSCGRCQAFLPAYICEQTPC